MDRRAPAVYREDWLFVWPRFSLRHPTGRPGGPRVHTVVLEVDLPHRDITATAELVCELHDVPEHP